MDIYKSNYSYERKKDHSHFYHDYKSLCHSLDMTNVTDNGACLRPSLFRTKYFSCLVKVSKTHLHAEY